MDKEIFEMYAGAIYLTEIVCIIFLVQSFKYLERLKSINFWFLVCLMIVGVYAGRGFARIYLQIWPTHFELSINWIESEVMTFLSAGYIIFSLLYTILVMLGVMKRPKS